MLVILEFDIANILDVGSIYTSRCNKSLRREQHAAYLNWIHCIWLSFVFRLYAHDNGTWRNLHSVIKVIQIKAPLGCQLTSQVLSKPPLKSRLHSCLSIFYSGCLTKYSVASDKNSARGPSYLWVWCEDNYILYKITRTCAPMGFKSKTNWSVDMN